MTSTAHSFASTLAHLVLTGTSYWAFSKTHYDVHGKYAWGAFILYLANGVAGVFRYGIPQHSNNYKFLQVLLSVYLKIRLWSCNLTLPLLALQICLLYGVELQMSLLLLAIPILHSLKYMVSKPFTMPELEYFSQYICIATLGYLSYWKNNDYGYAMTFSHFAALYLHRMNNELSKRDIYVYAQVFCIFFSFKTLHSSLPFYYRYFY